MHWPQRSTPATAPVHAVLGRDRPAWTWLAVVLALLLWAVFGLGAAPAHADEHDDGDDDSALGRVLDSLAGDDEDGDEEDDAPAAASDSKPESTEKPKAEPKQSDSKVQAAGQPTDQVEQRRGPTRGAASAPRLSAADAAAKEDGTPVTVQAPSPSVAPPEQTVAAPPRVVSVGVSTALLPDPLTRSYREVAASSTAQLLVGLALLLAWYQRRQRNRLLPRY